ncbi:hypothetical protein ACFLSG_00360 [Candidatus Bipolaricaulota bacterium]
MGEKANRKCIGLMELRPNNWYINRVKLDRVRSAWQREEQASIPPVLVTTINGELSLIDGHSRALAAWERGETCITANMTDLDDIEGSTALYRHIHHTGPWLGVETVADLAGRIVEPAEHERLWIGYCSQWLEANET